MDLSFCWNCTKVNFLPSKFLSLPPRPRFEHICFMFPLSIVPSLLPPAITLYGWFASTLLWITSSLPTTFGCWWSFSIDVILVDVLVVCNEVLDDFRCNSDFLPPTSMLLWPPVFLRFWLLIATVSFLAVLKLPLVDELDDELVWFEEPWRLC